MMDLFTAQKQLRGLGTALITPFKENGKVDIYRLRRLAATQVAGADFLVVLGTTGEAATLSPKEKRAVQKALLDCPLPQVLGVGGNNTAQVIETLQKSDLTPYSAILSVCPYYNKPSQEGLFQHFVAIAKASPIPVILYNVPGRTGVNLLPETVVRIYEAVPSKILGIKEASGKIEQIKQLIQLAHKRFLIWSGDDGLAADLMAAGADGLISVLSNAYPREVSALVHDRKQAFALQEHFRPLIDLLFKEGNPSGIKSALACKGLVKNVLRLPLVPNSLPVQTEIRNEIRLLDL